MCILHLQIVIVYARAQNRRQFMSVVFKLLTCLSFGGDPLSIW